MIIAGYSQGRQIKALFRISRLFKNSLFALPIRKLLFGIFFTKNPPFLLFAFFILLMMRPQFFNSNLNRRLNDFLLKSALYRVAALFIQKTMTKDDLNGGAIFAV